MKICQLCGHKFQECSVWQQYCSNCHQKKPIMGEEKIVKEKSTGRKKKFNDDIEKQILEMHSQNKSAAEISKHFNGHPGIPKVKRVIEANK